MRSRSLARALAVAGAGTIAAAVMFAPAAHSAESPKAVVKADVPEGYVLVSQDALRQLVRDEVSRQIQELVRRGEQQRAAAARMELISTMPQTARTQIMLYKLQHRDEIPTFEQMGDGFTFLTLTTDVAGRKSDGPNAFGPYFQHPLINPVTRKSKIARPGRATLEDGWSYDDQTGMVKIVLPRQLEPQLRGRVSLRDIEFAAAN